MTSTKINSDRVEGVSDGWIPVTNTWTRTGNHTFTVSGDVTTQYRKGTKVRYKDGGSYEYGVIGKSTYSSPNTTVTLITTTDYAMAATTITDTYLSYIDMPDGFPEQFSWTPTHSRDVTNYTNFPTITYAEWKTLGSRLFFRERHVQNATPGGSGVTYMTLPITPNASTTISTNPAIGMQESAGFAMMGMIWANFITMGMWKYDGNIECTASEAYLFTGSYEL